MQLPPVTNLNIVYNLIFKLNLIIQKEKFILWKTEKNYLKKVKN